MSKELEACKMTGCPLRLVHMGEGGGIVEMRPGLRQFSRTSLAIMRTLGYNL